MYTPTLALSGSLSLSVPLQNGSDVKVRMSLCFIHPFDMEAVCKTFDWVDTHSHTHTHTHTLWVWLALCVSNQTNRLRRREVRTLGRTDTKSERDNMVSVLWVNDGLSRPDARPETGGRGQGSPLPRAGCHGREPGAGREPVIKSIGMENSSELCSSRGVEPEPLTCGRVGAVLVPCWCHVGPVRFTLACSS